MESETLTRQRPYSTLKIRGKPVEKNYILWKNVVLIIHCFFVTSILVSILLFSGKRYGSNGGKLVGTGG